MSDEQLAKLRADVKAVVTDLPVRCCRQCGFGVDGVPPGMLWWCVQMHFNHRIELCEPCALAQIDRLMVQNPSCDRDQFIALFHKEPAEPCLRFCDARKAHRESNRWHPEVASEESE